MTLNTPDLSLAPGCFGMAMTYRAVARECIACPFAGECEPRAAYNLSILRAELGIKVTASTKAARSASPDGTPKKVLAHIERLGRLGVEMLPSLRRGENPISKEKGPQFLRLACHLLLKTKIGFSRDILAQCFVMKLGHTVETAAAHAKQTVQILEKLGAAQESDGLIRMRTQ